MPSISRRLVITADDFGLSPRTSAGILEACPPVTSTVLLVNSPHASDAVAQWRAARERPELGLHLCLTLDRPVLPPEQVRSLVGRDGRFHSLGQFVRRLLMGRVRPSELAAEIKAQLVSFEVFTGDPPALVNGHHHVHIFPLVRRLLASIFRERGIWPYVRAVRPHSQSPGSVLAYRKSIFLGAFGRRADRFYARNGFSGAETLIGLSAWNEPVPADFFTSAIRAARGELVELMVHPGADDDVGPDRSCDESNNTRRSRELSLIKDPAFLETVRAHGFRLMRPSQVARLAKFSSNKRDIPSRVA